MVKLKRVVEFDLSPYFESKQDEERLKAYLGDNLFNQYMEIKKKLPNLSNQFKDFSNIELVTDNKDKDIQNKKELVSSYNRLIDVLPKDKKALYRKRNITNFDRLSGKTLETLLNNYMKIRDIYFKDQERFRSFSQLMKQDIKDIQEWVNNYQSTSDKKKQDKIEGADKLYEDQDWIVYRITTYPAAQLYGSNTKWCITGRYPGHEGRGKKYFNDYIRDNNLDGGYYFYINKKDPNVKYCVLQTKNKEINSIWDASDTDKGSSYEDILDKDGVELPEVREVNLPKPNIEVRNLFKAIENKDIDTVKSILDKGIDPNIKDNYGDTPLHSASEEGHKEIVELLLNHGADSNVKNNNGKTPLYYASSGGHKDIVELLLKKGADPNIEDNYTPLHNASREGHKDIVELLLNNGADPNVKDNYRDTPLHKASSGGHKDIVELLLKYGADPNVKNKYGNTPLYYASIKGYIDIVELLLKNDADPNFKDNDGKTPLHNASSRSYNKDIVELLLKNGAEPNFKDNFDRTPLYYASMYGDKDIVELLKKYGAKENE